MSTLSRDLRGQLETTCIAARNLAETAAKAALQSLAVHEPEAYGHMSKEQKELRVALRARARQLGDTQDVKDRLAIGHLVQECAYEHWHRMLFARFLAENNLLIEPDAGVAISLDECKELAKEAKTDLWTLAGRYAQGMLPQIFRPDDPLLRVTLAKEHQIKLEKMLADLSAPVFTASDSLGWCYQFWQAERKDEVNAAGNKIGADELPAVTQLFTEDYMVDFLLDNTLGAWHAGKVLAANPKLAKSAKDEAELRKAVALPGAPWTYLRFVKGADGLWKPAAGTFDGWPKTAKELTCLDPCMGSGHFVVAMFERLVALRMAEEATTEKKTIPAVIRDNLFGLELDARCTQIGAFNLALAAWKRMGHCPLPDMNIACSGLAPFAKEADWLKLAGRNEKFQRGMGQLYRLFKQAPVLGSLINPRSTDGNLFVATFHELQPLMQVALAQESSDETRELAVTARGLAKAAEILSGQFTLVSTNVPYLGRGKQDEILTSYCERAHPNAKADLATCCVERCFSFCSPGGSAALVTPQNWLFLGPYKHLRKAALVNEQWDFVVRLGSGAFETISGEVVNVALLGFTHRCPRASHAHLGLDATLGGTAQAKAEYLVLKDLVFLAQKGQLNNPDSIITLTASTGNALLGHYANSYAGVCTGDYPRFGRCFWEVTNSDDIWAFQCSTVKGAEFWKGREGILRWENGHGDLYRFVAERLGEKSVGSWLRGKECWGRIGLGVSLMTTLPVSIYTGELFDDNLAVLVPKKVEHLTALLAFCSSPDFHREVRRINQKLALKTQYLVKVPFDLAHWQKVASEKYPHGLPKPFSSDPTQWLFNGHPKGADQPLPVAVARLLGYQWPRQTGSSFPDCPALGPDGLEKLADSDGIVCIPSVRGEEPAADRLRKLLTAALGKEWKANAEAELIRATESTADDLDEWLRNDFFDQHCALFHERPFVWHIWDGRKRDGFHALVNYHKLADGEKGRRLLEKLTHAYLGEWIARQKDGLKRGDEGADERLAAALALKERLEAIIEGEPPFDIFVRWKPLSEQAIGWEPDINDGVRMNIRPFLVSDLPNGKKGAGILRSKPNIKWDKDRGKEPHREKKDFPWFWSGSTFTGDRLNDVHLTNADKQKARKS